MLGCPPSVWKEFLTYHEYVELMVLYGRYPFGTRLFEVLFAMIAFIIAKITGSNNELEDFMMFDKRRKGLTPAEFVRVFLKEDLGES